MQQMINNSGFVSTKFNLIFFSNISSYYQMADLNVLFQSFLRKLQLSRFYFSVIFRRSRDQTKHTLAVTLLFQCNFLLVVGDDNLTGMTILFFYRILSAWYYIINTKVFIDFSIPSACTQTFPGIRQENIITDK